MIKNPCYIYWDDHTVAENERKIYIQCETCFKENKKGIKWSNLYGKKTIKCSLCDTIIYKMQKKKKKKNEQKNNDQTAI
jgi:hypothetical protein